MEKKRVVFYGRVSTQSEEQLSAFDNQMTWYQQLLLQHPDWMVVEEYEDAGVTGTSIRKRKGFQQMLDDGIKLHKYDLIVTRETKRFARNTVDALSYVRLLKQNGIEVYFVSDAIHTISDNDGELRLSIMATIAQEESRKTSENVRAGQRISRQNGILRGNGNILGYRRTGRNQYEIDLEQAVIVKQIYNWYLEGNGIRVIKQKLEACSYKTATGNRHWQFQVIDNILKNPFYTGKQQQLSNVSDGYLTQRRVKNSPENIEFIEGNYEPIISAEIFQEVTRIREKRYHNMNRKGKKESKSVWCGRYLCGCGCGTIRRNTSGEEYVFLCHSQHMRGIKKKAGDNDADEGCSLRTILEWKLDMIAYHVIHEVWKHSSDDILQALNIIEECYTETNTPDRAELDALKSKRCKLERRQQNLLDMRADGEITKEEYASKKEEYELEINKLNAALMKADSNQPTSADYKEKISSIKSALECIFDLSNPKLNNEIVSGMIWKLVHISDREFDLYLRMGSDSFGKVGSEEKVIPYKVFESSNPRREERVNCTKLKTIQLTYTEAVSYRAMSGKRVLKNKWEDLLVHIYL